MTFLYLDIESIPAQTQKAKDRIASTIKPPAQMKKAETIAAWEKDGKEQAINDAIDKTSFDGGLGHVCCLSWAIDDEPTSCVYLDGKNSEAQILQQFAMRMRDFIRRPTVVGHYVSGFDIRFITQRFIALGLKLPFWWPHEAKPWGDEIFDTMVKWAGVKGTISLDNLCFAMGIEGKGDVDGSMVAKMFADGEYDAIARYCIQDVEKVRQVHKRMMIALGE